jgi:FkbM family methyltransferase
MGTRTLSVSIDGTPVPFECFDNWLSKWTCEGILADQTYPSIPFVEDVRVVVDVGANCGAATVLLAHKYPGAQVYALEPGPEPFALLERNTAGLANVQVFNLGLSGSDDEVVLYRGLLDSGNASVHGGDATSTDGDLVQIRAPGPWLDEHGIDRIDVLKVDTEGCEVPILRGLGPLLAGVKILYLEFHSEDDRREIDALLAPTHTLAVCKAMFDAGEVVYLARDALPGGDVHHPVVVSWMQETFRRLLAGSAP